MTSNGNATLVVWSDFGSGTKVMAARGVGANPFELDATRHGVHGGVAQVEQRSRELS